MKEQTITLTPTMTTIGIDGIEIIIQPVIITK